MPLAPSQPTHKCSILYELNHIYGALGSNSNAHAYKTLVLWVWQAYQGIVHVPKWVWNEFSKRQLQLLALLQTCSGPVDLTVWGAICVKIDFPQTFIFHG